MALSILHLSDLHVTRPRESLASTWADIRNALPPGRAYDFVVISGDLVQNPGTPNSTNPYDEVYRFLSEDILPLLTEPHEPWRVIIVPGNHDIDRTAQVFTQVSMVESCSSPDSELCEKIENIDRNPVVSDLRRALSPHGHVEFFEIDESAYHSRFAPFSGFLTRFLGAGSATDRKCTYRPFQFSSSAPGQDWSAHVFPKLGIAFYGFNSCYRHDKYWRGAAISFESIVSAGKHAERHAVGCIPIAVWHHGLLAEANRVDALPLSHIQKLYAAGFRVGMHGHIHSSETDVYDWFGTQGFLLLAAGSLGAGSKDLPQGTGQQFGTVEILSRRRLTHTTYERTGGRSQQFQLRGRRTLFIGSPEAPQGALPEVESATRTYKTDSAGITTVQTEYNEIQGAGELILAQVREPYGGIEGDEAASVEGYPKAIEVRQEGRQFVLKLESEHTKKATWSYRVSNHFPLSKRDLECWDRGWEWRDLVGVDGQFHPHTVRNNIRRLNLRYEFPRSDVFDGSSTKLTAAVESSPAGWRVAEVDPSDYQLRQTKRTISASISAPELGWSYGPSFRFRQAPNVRAADRTLEGGIGELLSDCQRSGITADEISFLQELKGILREDPTGPELSESLADLRATRGPAWGISSPNQLVENRRKNYQLRVLLTLSIRQSLSDQLQSSFQGTNWIGFLWHKDRHVLAPVMGVFPVNGWSTRFAYGQGVAGHAFRFNSVAAWHREGGKHSVIYRLPRELLIPGGEHRWIACFPLTAGIDGHPVGVISFEGIERPQENVEQALEFVAESLCAGRTRSKKVTNTAARVLKAVNYGFWLSLKESGALQSVSASRLDRIIRSFR